MHKDTATLWPTYIFTYEYKDFQSDLKDELVAEIYKQAGRQRKDCLLYTSPSPRDLSTSRMPSSA